MKLIGASINIVWVNCGPSRSRTVDRHILEGRFLARFSTRINVRDVSWLLGKHFKLRWCICLMDHCTLYSLHYSCHLHLYSTVLLGPGEYKEWWGESFAHERCTFIDRMGRTWWSGLVRMGLATSWFCLQPQPLLLRV